MNGRRGYQAGLGVLLLVSLMATPAAAQEAGDVGMTVSAPSAIGMIWHVTERVAVRPDLAFSFGESDGDDGSPDVSSDTFSLGGSVLFYTGRWDNLQTYVAPRLSYTWSSSSIDTSQNDFEASQNSWGFSGSFGAQVLARQPLRGVCRGRAGIHQSDHGNAVAHWRQRANVVDVRDEGGHRRDVIFLEPPPGLKTRRYKR